MAQTRRIADYGKYHRSDHSSRINEAVFPFLPPAFLLCTFQQQIQLHCRCQEKQINSKIVMRQKTEINNRHQRQIKGKPAFSLLQAFYMQPGHEQNPQSQKHIHSNQHNAGINRRVKTIQEAHSENHHSRDTLRNVRRRYTGLRFPTRRSRAPQRTRHNPPRQLRQHTPAQNEKHYIQSNS